MQASSYNPLIILKYKLGHEFPSLNRTKLIMTAAVRHETLKSSLTRRVGIDRFHQFGCRSAVFRALP